MASESYDVTDNATEFECEEGSILDHFHVKTTFIVAYVVVFLMVAFGNAFTILVIIVHRSMRTSTNFFLANLALADMLVAVFCILQNLFHTVASFGSHWPFGDTVCKLYVFFLHTIPCTSIGILICVSAEKYIAVLHPLLALKLLTRKLRGALMVGIWCFSIFFNLPYYFTAKEFHFGDMSSCSRDIGEHSWFSLREMITASFVFWYCLPLVIIAYLYAKIGHVLWLSTLRPLEMHFTCAGNNGTPTITVEYDSKSTLDRVNSNGLPPRTSNDDAHTYTSDVLESRKKIIRLLIAIVCSFALLTLPHHARLLHSVWSTEAMCTSGAAGLLQPLTYLALFLSSGVNPLLYAFMSQRFRGAVQDIVNCRIGALRRKFTRTRTLISDMGDPSRSPSLLSREPPFIEMAAPGAAAVINGNRLAVAAVRM